MRSLYVIEIRGHRAFQVIGKLRWNSGPDSGLYTAFTVADANHFLEQKQNELARERLADLARRGPRSPNFKLVMRSIERIIA